MRGFRRRATSGVLLLLAGAAILMGIITAEALYPAPYHTDTNTISDLGGTEPPEGLVLQPSAAIFDTTMVVAGLLVVVAAVLSRRSITTLLLGLGILGVGVFPGNTSPHPYFALLAFAAGGCAGIASARAAPPPLRYVLAGLGTIALAALVAGLFLLEWSPIAALGRGGIERWIAYPVVLWLVIFGTHLVSRSSGVGSSPPVGDFSNVD
jgi:hypothetical membrane protein